MIVAYDSAPEGRGANAHVPEAATPPACPCECHGRTLGGLHGCCAASVPEERDALAARLAQAEAERDKLIVQLDATRRELADSDATRREYARQLREAKRELEAARDRLSPPDTAADPMEAPDAG